MHLRQLIFSKTKITTPHITTKKPAAADKCLDTSIITGKKGHSTLTREHEHEILTWANVREELLNLTQK